MEMDLIAIADELTNGIAALRFCEPVSLVYNPLAYARAPYVEYVHRYGSRPKETLLVGMNPGPWGMAQTGIPFGDVQMVREWLAIEAPVGQPAVAHPRRPVAGFGCRRRERSGERVWGWARQRYGSPANFFARFFIVNYCPLLFLDRDGGNRTPDQLRAADRQALFAACDRALSRTVEWLRPSFVAGFGCFAGRRVAEVLAGRGIKLGTIPHPSPANPAANRDWQGIAERALVEIGIRL